MARHVVKGNLEMVNLIDGHRRQTDPIKRTVTSTSR
jgi:hypothetical protein